MFIGGAWRASYGLAAYVFTADLQRADAAVAGLEAGMIGVNRWTWHRRPRRSAG